MTDTTESKQDGDVKKKPGKLSLNKIVDRGAARPSGPGRSSSVKVEVRKTRSFTRDESGKMFEVVKAPKKAPGAEVAEETYEEAPDKAGLDTPKGKKPRTLTMGEKEARRKALEQAANEPEPVVEEYHPKPKRDKKTEEPEPEAAIIPDIIDAPADDVTDTHARKLKKKKKDDDDFEDGDSSTQKTAKKRGKRIREEGDENIHEYEDLAPSEILAKEVLDPEEARLTIKERIEFEDYSEDDGETDDNDGVVAVTHKDESAVASGIVRAINASERIIIAAPDPERIKKNLRSEAPVSKMRSRSDDTRSATASMTATSAAAEKRPIGTPKRKRRGPVKADYSIKREVIIPETILVGELANRMAVRVVDVVKELMKAGEMVTQNEPIDADTAELVVQEFGHTPIRVTDEDLENELFDQPEEDASETLKARAPIVTVMGHVDHGKTSLLDALRATDVVAGESGGITQHIGAYQVQLESGEKITFIDTPGHAAFTAMRARGAKVTDIVILVVAADDGIKDQTVEAIAHAKAAQVPIIVAINKMDKPEADSGRVRNELMSHELVPEEFGGDIMCVDVSAIKRTNLDKLAEAVLLQSEVLELKANYDAPASGVVAEARMEKGRGVVATVLIQRGTLRVGDIIIAGKAFGRVKAMLNDRGAEQKEATPGMPVEVLGFNEAPNAGDPLAVAESEKQARDITDTRTKQERQKKATVAGKLSLETLFTEEGSAKVKELPIIIKADVHGSAEAIVTSLQKIESNEVRVNVIHSAVGGITESDVSLAHASGAIILGFNTRANAQAKELAHAESIDIQYYSVIYNLVDDVTAALTGMLDPTFKENFMGYAEVREVFHVSKVGKVAGCMVTSGEIKRGAKVRLLRDDVVIHEGSLKTLKRFKEDAKEVREGFECGMAFENYDDLRAGDQIEAFELIEQERKL